MKKILGVLMTLLILLPDIAYGQKDDWNEVQKKEFKNKMKEFKKGKWKVFGSSRTLEVLLTYHLDWLNNREDVYEIVGVASGFKSMNMGKQKAMNNAFVAYASQISSTIKGRAVSDMKAEGNQSEFDQFYGVFERSVQQEIRGELKESFSLIREKDNGTFEMQTFFLVNEEAALDARRRALKNAAKEAIAAEKYADIVSKYINEKVIPSKFYEEDAGRNL